MPGASVQVQGTSQGTITDLDGKFAFNVPNKNSILVISFIGYVTVEIKADTQKPMVITLKEDTKTLDEVVVVGYQEIRKRDLTGSVAKASMAELLSTPTASFGYGGVFHRETVNDIKRRVVLCQRIVTTDDDVHLSARHTFARTYVDTGNTSA